MEVPHSNSCDAGGEVRPDENLTLQLLEDAFAGHSASRADLQTQEQREGRPEHRMGFEELQEALRSITGPDSEAGWLERFFHEVDISRTTGRVEDYLLEQHRERGRLSIPRDAVVDTEPRITHCTHNKRQPITRVVAVPSPPPLRYISVSKAGMLTVLNTRLHILKTLQLAGDPAADGSSRKPFKGWTTDAVYMAHAHKVAIATSYNDIHIVDVTTSAVSEDIHLYGFLALPTALCYWHDAKHPEQHPLLLWGDEKGGAHLMRFLKPSRIENPFTEDTSTRKIYMPSLLGDIKRLVSYHHIPNIHHEPINRVMYEPYTDLILTSSGSDTSSVVIMDVSRRLKPYIWRIDKGVMCFDYSRALKLVVTGGLDPVVRLWNRYVPARPSATLEGHLTTVLDVAIYHPVGQIFSYSRDDELRVWDISSHACLRTLRLQFPCVLPGRHPEHGNFPFLLTPPLQGKTRPHLLVGCKDYLAQLRLAEGTENQDVDPMFSLK